ncbi:Co2+/Mg2+ efflux protein ApaG [Inhella gelatinilytica]|uniref:Co2+/Mg2+ efflux protein ApaG n=1 Tax=Inhella gelatinilytica TaxID=2795030 RepID=A0A931IWR1_9BURK|nr:Co2+/Mg2+ efflux protein ApaG [Inhella gelatinilytica]MBH9553569.1 Co2+/Mg2+ efflux protein ApaG [Inhella gelatinilytica]
MSSSSSRAEFRCSVAVQPLAEQTDPAQERWAFQYTVTIENTGTLPAQLVARQWSIVDARGQVEEVRGLAVVGHQPYLQPGQSFQYSSWAQIGTPHGSMKGRYLCVSEAAEVFYAEVPEFALADTSQLH